MDQMTQRTAVQLQICQPLGEGASSAAWPDVSWCENHTCCPRAASWNSSFHTSACPRPFPAPQAEAADIQGAQPTLFRHLVAISPSPEHTETPNFTLPPLSFFIPPPKNPMSPFQPLPHFPLPLFPLPSLTVLSLLCTWFLAAEPFSASELHANPSSDRQRRSPPSELQMSPFLLFSLTAVRH